MFGLTSSAITFTGCTESADENLLTPSIHDLPQFHATNAGVVSDIESLEQVIHELTNKFRAEEGREAYGYNKDLAAISRNHSRNMAKESFFAHVDHEGRGPGERADYFGYPDAHISENLFQANIPSGVNSTEKIAKQALLAWKNSPTHRGTLLEQSKIVAGVGGYITEKKEIFVTTMYADIDGEIQS